jgi:hypothetical protein
MGWFGRKRKLSSRPLRQQELFTHAELSNLLEVIKTEKVELNKLTMDEMAFRLETVPNPYHALFALASVLLEISRNSPDQTEAALATKALLNVIRHNN